MPATILRLTALLFAAIVPLAALQAQSNYATPYTFTPLAGNAVSTGSTDGAGSAARFNQPEDVAVDGSGNVFVADTMNHTIRRITPAGLVSTFAGVAGSSGSTDGTGSAARFCDPSGIAVDGAGNLYVADTNNATIRKITPAGLVSTLAGIAGSAGSVDSTGTAAQFRFPSGVAVDGVGNVYVADNGNNTVRKITPDGAVITLAGTAGSSGSTDGTGSAARFNVPWGVAVDGLGNVFVADSNNYTIRKITPAGLVSTFAGIAGSSGSTDGTGSAARFYYPGGVATDGSGAVYVADSSNSEIRKITPDGVVTTVAGSYLQGSSDGTGSAAHFNNPKGVAVDGSGNVYVADWANSTIRKITSAAAVTTLAGFASIGSADGTGDSARFFNPDGVAVDGSGNVYVADTSNYTIRKITPSGVVTTLAGMTGSSGSADGTGSAAQFNYTMGIAVDAADNVYVADYSNTIRKITPAGVVTTLAGTAGTSGSTDGTGSAARFDYLRGIAVDGSGNVYVGDTNNNTIRKIDPAGVVTTLAGTAGASGSTDGIGSVARFDSPRGVAVDGSGNVYVVDSNNSTIRVILSPTGQVFTLAGTAGTSGSADGMGAYARFNYPAGGLAVDGAGNVYVPDTWSNTIRKIDHWGMVTTLAGGSWGSTDGTGSAARFNFPLGIAADVSGNLYVADTFNSTIRKGVPPVITVAPAISTQPTSQGVTAGGNASFTVSATGTPSPTYQWQINTDGGSTWTDLTDTAPYSDTTTGTLTITGATFAMNGYQFRCVASNGVPPDATSDAATLTVILTDHAFLQRLFLNVLGRDIDPGALAAFEAVLAGGRSRPAVLGDLFASAEYNMWQIEPAIRLYYAAFNRIPDYGGLQNWSNALHAGAVTLTGAADYFAGSPEFIQTYGNLDNTGYVQQLYRNVLGREADEEGLANWVAYLNGGATRGQVLVGFSESDEFKADMADQVEVIRLCYLLKQQTPTPDQLHGWLGFLRGYDQTDTLFALGYPSGLSDADYVQAVFQGFLRRDAGAGELSAYGSALAAGALSHGDLVDTLLKSAEFNLFVAPVSRLYLAALRRVPDAPGLNNWVNYVRAGTSLQVMADAFAASQEFINRYGAMSNRDYVAQLYRDVLGREADTAGLADWTGRLDAGTATRGGILIGFSESQEAIHLFAPTVRTFLHYFAFLNATPTQSDLDYWKNYLATLDDQLRNDLLADPAFTGGG